MFSRWETRRTRLLLSRLLIHAQGSCSIRSSWPEESNNFVLILREYLRKCPNMFFSAKGSRKRNGLFMVSPPLPKSGQPDRFFPFFFTSSLILYHIFSWSTAVYLMQSTGLSPRERRLLSCTQMVDQVTGHFTFRSESCLV